MNSLFFGVLGAFFFENLEQIAAKLQKNPVNQHPRIA